GQDLVQRLPEVGRRFSNISPDLVGIFLPALLDLVLEELLEVPIPETFLPLAGMVYHHIGNESSGQPARFERRILREERVGGAAGRWDGGTGRPGNGWGRRRCGWLRRSRGDSRWRSAGRRRRPRG